MKDWQTALLESCRRQVEARWATWEYFSNLFGLKYRADFRLKKSKVKVTLEKIDA